jgi:hypothetical protein
MDEVDPIGLPMSAPAAERAISALQNAFRMTLDQDSGMGDMTDAEAAMAREAWNAQWMAVTFTQTSVAERDAAAGGRAREASEPRALRLQRLAEDSLELLRPDGGGRIPDDHLQPIGDHASGEELRAALAEKFPYVVHHVRRLRLVFGVCDSCSTCERRSTT